MAGNDAPVPDLRTQDHPTQDRPTLDLPARELAAREGVAADVAAYKGILRAVIDRRPSGTRRRLAAALGKHRSFVTQITNPAYPVPIPAQHLKVIFEICHVSPQERGVFLETYARAHPARAASALADAALRTLAIPVPDLGNAARNRALDALILDIAARLVRHAEDET